MQKCQNVLDESEQAGVHANVSLTAVPLDRHRFSEVLWKVSTRLSAHLPHLCRSTPGPRWSAASAKFVVVSWDFDTSFMGIWLGVIFLTELVAQVKQNPMTWKMAAFTTAVHHVSGAQSKVQTVCVSSGTRLFYLFIYFDKSPVEKHLWIFLSVVLSDILWLVVNDEYFFFFHVFL